MACPDLEGGSSKEKVARTEGYSYSHKSGRFEHMGVIRALKSLLSYPVAARQRIGVDVGYQN